MTHAAKNTIDELQATVVVIVCEGIAGAGHFTPQMLGQYLEMFDPDAYEGRGAAKWTDQKERALKFPNAGAALEEWRRASTVRPLRPDGQPNRPLTAFSVGIVRLES